MADCTQFDAAVAQVARWHLRREASADAAITKTIGDILNAEDKPFLTREEVVNSIFAYQRSLKTAAKTSASQLSKNLKELGGNQRTIDRLAKRAESLSSSGALKDPKSIIGNLTAAQRKDTAAAMSDLREIERGLDEIEHRHRQTPEMRQARVVSSIARASIKGRSLRLKNLIGELARIINPTIKTRDELVDAVHNEIADVVPEGWTRRDTMDAISGYGDYRKLNDNEQAAKLRDIRGQLQQVAKLDDMIRLGEAPRKSGFERATPSDEQRRLIQEVNAVKQELGIEADDPNLQLRSTREAILRGLRNRAADIEYQIQTKRRIKRSGNTTPNDAEITARREEVKRLKKVLEETVGPDADARKRRIQQRIDRLEAKIKAGGATPARPDAVQGPKEADEARADTLTGQLGELRRVRQLRKQIEDIRHVLLTAIVPRKARAKAVTDNKEIAALTIERNMGRIRVNRLVEELRPKTPLEKTHAALGALRDISATGDLPPLWRQGFIGAVLYPGKAARALFKALRAVWSASSAADTDAKLRTHENFQRFVDYGQYYSPVEGGSMTQKEEEAMSTIAEKIPLAGRLVRSGGRGMATFLNTLNFQIANSYYENMIDSAAFDPSIDIDKSMIDLASMLNDFRGRAKLGPDKSKREQVMRALSIAGPLFSARNWLSRIKMATLYHAWRPQSSRYAREIAIRELTRLFGRLSILAMLIKLAGGEIEDDLRSPAFGKVKLGSQNIDMTGQIGAEISFITRIASGLRKTFKGEIEHSYGYGFKEGDRMDLTIVRKVKSKLSPAYGFLWDLAARADYGGEPIEDIGDAAMQFGARAVPMSWGDIADAARHESAPTAIAASILSLFGAGQQDMDEDAYQAKLKRQKDAQKRLEAITGGKHHKGQKQPKQIK